MRVEIQTDLELESWSKTLDLSKTMLGREFEDWSLDILAHRKVRKGHDPSIQYELISNRTALKCAEPEDADRQIMRVAV